MGKRLNEERIKDHPVVQEYIQKNGWHYEIHDRGSRKSIYWFNQDDKAVCGAIKKPDKECLNCGYTYHNMPVCVECGGTEFRLHWKGLCGASPMENGRCRKHGGKSIMGLAHYNFQTGEDAIASFLPQRLQERYLKGLDDPELLSLRKDISVNVAIIEDMLSKLDTAESGENWRLVKKQFGAMKRAAKAGDKDLFAHHTNQIGKLIDKGYSEYQTWNEVMRAQTNKRKLIESERKRMVELQQMMTVDESMALLSFVAHTFKNSAYKHISDREQANAMLSEVSVELNKYVTAKKGKRKVDE